jgi:Ca2+:H+ antiporter
VPRWIYPLLILVPATVAVRFFNLPEIVVFATSALALLPVAGLIGAATESLAHHFGPRLGGLLNATFGNAAELIITLFAIHEGLITLVKASITGSIIGNSLLVLGVALTAGGIRHGKVRFDSQETGLNAALMILAVAGLYLPAVFAATVGSEFLIEELSILVAAVLIVMYLAYLVQTVWLGPRNGAGSGATAGTANEASGEAGSGGPVWSVRTGALVLAGATVAAAVCSEVLVGSVQPVAREFGLSEFFVGVVIVAFIGNAAEHFSAVQMAWNKRLDATLAITAGSSTQIALFVAPILVFASLLVGHPMNLIFTPLELAILGLGTAFFAYISIDGESNWLEGVQLLGIYLIAALAFGLLPAEGR